MLLDGATTPTGFKKLKQSETQSQMGRVANPVKKCHDNHVVYLFTIKLRNMAVGPCGQAYNRKEQNTKFFIQRELTSPLLEQVSS
jgi:hypothetical protein